MAKKHTQVEPTNTPLDIRPDGCKPCENTGFENGKVGASSNLCPECGGSPYGVDYREDTTVSVDESTASQESAGDSVDVDVAPSKKAEQATQTNDEGAK